VLFFFLDLSLWSNNLLQSTNAVFLGIRIKFRFPLCGATRRKWNRPIVEYATNELIDNAQ
jgi:hypothetical protein